MEKDDDNSNKRYVEMSPEVAQAFAKTLTGSLLAKKNREWDDVIIKKHFNGRQMSAIEKGIFEMGYVLAIQNYALYLRDNCWVGMKNPEMAPAKEPETSPRRRR
jgi:hypothetical protein